MNDLTPATAIALFGMLANLDWRPLSKADHHCFCDAGENALIADLADHQHGAITELLDLRVPAETGLLAIIGGDGLQVELHGCTEDGEPIAWTLPLAPFTN